MRHSLHFVIHAIVKVQPAEVLTQQICQSSSPHFRQVLDIDSEVVNFMSNVPLRFDNFFEQVKPNQENQDHQNVEENSIKPNLKSSLSFMS